MDSDPAFHFDTNPNPAFNFDTDPDPAFQFDPNPDPTIDTDPDPDPYHFKEETYLKQYFLYIFIWFFLSVGPTGPNQKAYFVKISLPVNFVVFIRVA